MLYSIIKCSSGFLVSMITFLDVATLHYFYFHIVQQTTRHSLLENLHPQLLPLGLLTRRSEPSLGKWSAISASGEILLDLKLHLGLINAGSVLDKNESVILDLIACRRKAERGLPTSF